MKIAVLQDDFPPHHEGGSGVIALQLSREYARRGHEVLVISSVQTPELAGVSDVDGMRVVRLYSDYHVRWRAYRSLYNPGVVGKVKTLLKDFQPDVVHVHNVHTHLSYYSFVLARRYARSVYMTAHDVMSFHFGKLLSANEDPENFSEEKTYVESPLRQIRIHGVRYNPLHRMFVRHILNNTVRRVLAVSESLKRALVKNRINNVDVVHNGIEINDWKESSETVVFKKTHGIGDAAILFGGRISTQKGAFAMLDAFQKVREKVPHAQLMVIGKKDAYAKPMIERARELGVEEGLVFAGWITGNDIRSAYYAAAVVAVPSLYLDPFPTINLEAFACGRPVVATCFGGSREIVEDGISGFVVNPLETKTMAEKIAMLLDDEEMREKFGRAGYEHVVKDFSLTSQAEKYLKIFTESAA
jgi:glycosyltransferase involved in cell wall biosynthesis